MGPDSATFIRWLDAYGRAWKERDPDGVAELFTPDARYYWTPFDQPKLGRQQITEAWLRATTGQRDIHFRHELLCVSGTRGIARWWCSFERLASGRPVRLAGVLCVEMDDRGLCCEFREWWHSDEPVEPTTREAES